jgi:DNA-binding SARP family transcriptional activator/Tfp pilus assembly protein PilF
MTPMAESTKKPLNMEAKFLGNFEIKIGGCLIGGFTTQKTRALAVYLLLEHFQEHPRSKLAALFWPDVPEQTALHNLRQALSSIRKAFDVCNGDEVLISNREMIGFQPNVEFSIDALEFETQMRRMIERCHRQSGRGFPVHRMKRLVDSYHGEILGQLDLGDGGLFEDWLIVKRERLNQLAIEGSSLLLDYYERRCEWGEAKKTAELLVSLAPWDENAHSRLIEVLLQLSQGNAALAHYQAALRYFTSVLEVEPDFQLRKANASIQEFFTNGKTERSRKPESLQIASYATPFIGRAQELETLEDWVSDPSCRIITITGPGGSGKTRLAAMLVELQRTQFVDGVYFVSIAGCLSIGELASRIISSVSNMGERSANPLDELLDWAHKRRGLLILDNVDTCSDCATLAAKITEVADQMVIVFTSYARLDLMGERVFALKGLSTREGVESEAVSLFISHLQHESQLERMGTKFTENVVRICELVDGLPLAIDLAAGQVKTISSEELLHDLAQNMDILRSNAVNLPERHRSITASFENSWKHLSGSLQRTLSMLTVFQSAFTLEAAEQVCGVGSQDIRNLTSQSLLTRDIEENYRFHRVIKQYAREKINREEDQIIKLDLHHANYFCEQLLRNHANSTGSGFLSFIKTTEAVISDIEKGIRYLVDSHDWVKVQKLIHPLFCYFDGKGLLREGSSLLGELAELCSKDPNGMLCQAMFSSRAARLLLSIQQFAKASELLDLSLTVYQAKKNQEEEAFCYNVLAIQALLRKNASSSEELAQKAFQIARKAGNKYEETHSLYNTGYAAINIGDITKAEEALTNCRILCEELGDWRRLSKVHNLLADTACSRGNFEQALGYYDEALKMVVAIGNRFSESLVLNNIGTAYISLGQHSKAEEYYEKSRILCGEIGDREGEAIALSNLGELYAESRDFKKGIEYNQRALEISREIESDWGEVAARVMLATCYRELGDKRAAQEEVIRVLQKSHESEFTTFFYRGVIEASLQLLDRGQGEGLAAIVEEISRGEETDDWTRTKAQAVLTRLPGCGDEKAGKADPQAVAKFLVETLQKG